jgi:hypothetical protein
VNSASHFEGIQLRPVKLPGSCPYRPVGLALGQGSSALEVLVTAADSEPRLPNVRSVWKTRSGGRAAPLILLVIHDGKAVVCGPAGDDPPAYPGVDLGQAARICREALEQPDRHAALRCLRDALPSVESKLPGVRNEGFLATHELVRGVRDSERWAEAWADADRKARPILTNRGDALLRSLGFTIEKCDQVTSILRAGPHGTKTAVAVLLNQNESAELHADRFGKLSPVSYALAVADRENLRYVLVLQGSKLRLYPVKVGVGVGRRGRTETYVEVHTGLLRDADAGYLWLLFSAEALVEGGTLQNLLDESKRFAGELAERLRIRIYGEVVPRLAEGLAAARGLKKPTAKDLTDTYEMAMTVLFRLLFIAYAEDKDLLPYRWNGLYRARSLKMKATELLEVMRAAVLAGEPAPPFDDSATHWEEVQRLFRAVEKGNREWGVPEYNGGLFSSDPAESTVGALLADVTIPNRVMGVVLKGLLLTETPEGWGPVDFRSLGVREFGTVYEGLLESELSVAETDLTVDREGYYRPCRRGEEPLVKKSRIYLHNRSGARKATGTYFTKEFAVEHLLSHALDPAIRDHLERLDELDDDAAGEAFFDFRVADIAMGSGHFLVAAVDHIEQAFTQYLAKRPLSGVRAELAKLRASATEALGNLAEQVEIEDTQLLRRLIARRCIYGVDINPVAVDLARLSIWIHTFVPGLPLSLLDHNLVVGNSLVGIGTLPEIEVEANKPKVSVGRGRRKAAKDAAGQIIIHDWLEPKRLLGEALEPLRRLAMITDLTAAEIKRARKAMKEAREKIRPAEALCDIVTACRMQGENLPIDLEQWDENKDDLPNSDHHKGARQAIGELMPLHFPVAFPEVFLRKRSGFDVILGNPPWEEATLEEHGFWARHFPGFRGLSQGEQEAYKERLRSERPDLAALYDGELVQAANTRRALVSGPYPGMGVGDPDLYKAFSWRFWDLTTRQNGRMGVVLPRSALSAKGSTQFRVGLFSAETDSDITVLVNYREWVFDGVHQQYAVGLVAVERGTGQAAAVKLRGPFYSRERYELGVITQPYEFAGVEVMSWTDTASLPLLPAEESLAAFARLRRAPRLDLDEPGQWRAWPHRELDATNDKRLMDLKSHDRPRGFWPVYKGESFHIWEPGTGSVYAWGDPKDLIPHLQNKRLRGGRNRRSAFSEFDIAWLRSPKTLPCYHARIAFRDGTNRLNERTVIAALVPGNTLLGNQAPFLLWPRGDWKDEAFLLGVLSSLPLDWYARRFVERHLNFFLFCPLPIPRPGRDDPLWLQAVALAGRLAAVDDRYAEWARAVGVDCGPLDPEQRYDMICELDAVVALLYGLEEKHLLHIFETFHEGWGPGTTAEHPTLGDYDERLKLTMSHCRSWKTRPKRGKE